MTDLAENGLDGQRQIAASVSEPYLRALRKHLFSSSPQKKGYADLRDSLSSKENAALLQG